MSDIAGKTDARPPVFSRAPATSTSTRSGFGSLHEVTRRRLTEFHSRRTRLETYRGIALATVAFVSLLLLSVCIDAMFTAQGIRWLGCLLVLCGAGAVGYRYGIRHLVGTISLREEAWRFERRDPRLRDRLLSAVEFSDEPETSFDSIAFRDHLQQQVADTIAPVRIEYLLPWDKIRKPLWVAAGAVILAMSLCFVPGLRFPQRAARILLPFADLGRVTHLAVELDRPLPHSKRVPTGDVVAFTASVYGGTPKSVNLEIESEAGLSSLAMPELREANDEGLSKSNRSSISRFQATHSALEEQLRYRVVADGATTPWYQITTRPRPTVKSFEKTISAPEYAGSERTIRVEQDGDMTVLEGCQIELAIDVERPVRSAELRWDDENLAPLTLLWDSRRRRHVGMFTADRSREYRIHLIDQETGFNNDYSRSHKVVVQEDAPPQILWLSPSSGVVAIGATEVVSLMARISDEHELAKIDQLIRLNDGEWASEEFSVPASARRLESSEEAIPLRTMEPDWQLDLLDRSLTAGDSLEIKLAATDKHGFTTESTHVRILISLASIDVDPPQSEISRLELAKRIAEFSAAVSALAKPFSQSNAESSTPRETARLFVERLRSDGAVILQELQQAALQLDDPVDAVELRLVGELVAQILTENAGKAAGLSSTAVDSAALDQLFKIASNTDKQISSLATHFRSMVSHDVARRHTRLLSTLADAQHKLAGQTKTNAEQWKRQQDVLLRQLQDVQQSMLDASEDLSPQIQTRYRQSADRVGTLIGQAERQLENANPEQMRAIAKSSGENLRATSLMSRIDGNLYESVNTAHSWLNANVESPGKSIQRFAQSVADRPMNAVQANSVLEQLSLRRAVARADFGSDKEYASDLGNARRAVQSMMDAGIQSDNSGATAADYHRIAGAVLTLSAAAELRVASSLLSELLEKERWSMSDLGTISHNPRNWDTFSSLTERAVRLTREAKLPNELASQIDQLRWIEPAQIAARRITSRRWEESTPISAASQLEQLTARARAAEEKLRPFVEEARAVLQRAAPSLAELAQKAADETKALSAATRDLAEDAASNEKVAGQTALSQLKDDLQKLDAPMQNLREALVDNADAQNLLDPSELQRARNADAAIDIVDLADKSMRESMESLAPNENDSLPSADLANAAEIQSDAAKALNSMAELFRQSTESADANSIAQASDTQPIQNSTTAKQPDDASNSGMQSALEELTGNMNSQPPRRDTQLAYESAEQLSKIAQTDPRRVLEALEKQIPNNVPMQAELSEIAREAAQLALAGLSQAANDQSRISPSLENSDPRLVAQKRLLIQDLQSARENAFQVLGLLLSEAKWTAGAGKAVEEENMIAELEQVLQATLDASENANENVAFDALLEKARALQQTFSNMQQSLAQVGSELSEAIDEKIHQNGADLNNRRREMKDRQRRIQQQDVRNLQQAARSLQQATSQVENRIKQLTQQLKARKNELTKQEKRLEQRPEDTGLREDIARRRNDLNSQQTAIELEIGLKDALDAKVKQAQTATQDANKQDVAPLQSTNPSVELSASLAELAASRSSQLAKSLQVWSKNQAPTPSASRVAIEAAEKAQSSIVEGVDEAANNLSRAARHEARLQNEALSEQLAAQSEQVKALESEELAEAQSRVNDLLSRASENTSETTQPMSPNIVATQQASDEGAQAIAEAAARLSMLLGQGSQADDSSNASPSQGGDSSSEMNSLLEPEKMAHLLDELDRQVNQDLNLGAKEDDAQKPASNSNQSQVPPTLSEAAKQLAAQMSRDRAPPTPANANSDMGMATESQQADVNPQGPERVQVSEVTRVDGDWGSLQSQRAEGAIETRRSRLAPQFREQVEAYFRNLSIRGLNEQEPNE